MKREEDVLLDETIYLHSVHKLIVTPATFGLKYSAMFVAILDRCSNELCIRAEPGVSTFGCLYKDSIELILNIIRLIRGDADKECIAFLLTR